MAARAIARNQLQMAWQAENDRIAMGASKVDRPALFNLTLSVRENEENETTIPVPIAPGQTPREAAHQFRQIRGITDEVEHRIADKLAEDQLALAWDVAAEQFGPNRTVADYIVSRLGVLTYAEIHQIQTALTVRT